MTGPEKTGLIYTKYTSLYDDTYLLLGMCYTKPVSFINFHMVCCIYDEIFDTILIKDNKLLHIIIGEILHVDKIGFLTEQILTTWLIKISYQVKNSKYILYRCSPNSIRKASEQPGG